MQRRRRRPTRHPGRVHPLRRRRAGLLRRESGRRVQRPDGGGRERRVGDVWDDGVRGGSERAVPRGAEGGGGLPERVRGVREAGVLLQRGVRDSGPVPSVGLLGDVQVGVSELV